MEHLSALFLKRLKKILVRLPDVCDYHFLMFSLSLTSLLKLHTNSSANYGHAGAQYAITKDLFTGHVVIQVSRLSSSAAKT